MAVDGEMGISAIDQYILLKRVSLMDGGWLCPVNDCVVESSYESTSSMRYLIDLPNLWKGIPVPIARCFLNH